MSKLINKMRYGKYLSFLVLVCMTFTFASEFRYYINQSIYAAFNLGNLGPFGAKLDVSVLVAVFASVGWAAGVLTAFLTEKKRIRTVTLYWLSGLFAVVALFFTPYNLQLLMPSTIMQNIAMIACIAHIVFILADTWLFSWAICAGVKDICAGGGKSGTAFIAVATLIATVLSYLSIIYQWSFVVATAVYGGVLTAVNVLHAAFPEKDCDIDESDCGETLKAASGIEVWSARGAVTVLYAVVLIGAHFITQPYIAIA